MTLITSTTLAYGQNKTILFVCEHGSAKSVMATAYFNKLARERDLPWEAITRGTDPEEKLSHNTERGLQNDGLLERSIKPQKLTQEDLDHANKVVLFFPLPSNLRATTKCSHWNNLPQVSEGYQKARDAILVRIKMLVDSLANH